MQGVGIKKEINAKDAKGAKGAIIKTLRRLRLLRYLNTDFLICVNQFNQAIICVLSPC